MTGFLIRTKQHINTIADLIYPILLKCYVIILTAWIPVKWEWLRKYIYLLTVLLKSIYTCSRRLCKVRLLMLVSEAEATLNSSKPMLFLEAYSELCQTSKLGCFAKTLNNF